MCQEIFRLQGQAENSNWARKSFIHQELSLISGAQICYKDLPLSNTSLSRTREEPSAWTRNRAAQQRGRSVPRASRGLSRRRVPERRRPPRTVCDRDLCCEHRADNTIVCTNYLTGKEEHSPELNQVRNTVENIWVVF